MKEQRNVILFYVSVVVLALAAVCHLVMDLPDTQAGVITNIVFTGAVIFLLVMTICVFRPQIRRTSDNIELMNATLSQINLLKTVATAANEAESTKEGLQIAIDTICDYTGWSVGHVYMYSEEKRALICSGVWRLNDPERCEAFKKVSSALVLESHQGFVGEVYTDSTPMWILNVADSSVHTRKEIAADVGLKAAFAFPIFVGKKAVAVMEFYSHESKIPGEELLSVMSNIGKQLGQTIERERTMKKLKRANLKAEAAARDLKESLEKAEAANIAKSDFLANMSHELRTPMNGVLGMAQLLADTPMDEEQKELVSTINSSGESLLMLLNDILDFSKIEAGALVLENIPYNVSNTMRQTVQLLTPNADKKQIQLLLDMDDAIPAYVMGDSGRMRQILTNLLGNSIKFTHQGYVRISGRMTEHNAIDQLHVRVEDTGIGIPQSKLADIFEKFTQADTSVTRKYGGTGLGLAITKQLIALMGGDIGVESVEGKGSTFWFTIPCIPTDYCKVDTKDASETRLHVQERIHVSQAKVLLVEDYYVNQVFAEKLLKKFGFTNIDLVENGAEAIKKYRTCAYDVIFMDCQMPEIDGYQATGKIREIEQDTPLHTPIVAMTANAMMGDREKCLKAGMDDYISKPLRAEHLRAILQGLFIMDDANAATTVVRKGEKSPSDQEIPAVDIEQLRVFTDGDREEEKALGELFLQQATEIIALLNGNTAEDKCEIWKSAAHRFKGASGNLGAMKLHHLFKRAESHFEDNGTAKQEMLAAITAETKRVEVFFAAN